MACASISASASKDGPTGQGPAPAVIDSTTSSLMNLIPVLDLAGGIVVHARRGRREQYAPLRSSLLEGHQPLAVLPVLVATSGGSAAYLADLDALAGGDRQEGLLRQLAAASPVSLWIDAAYADAASCIAARRSGWIPVVASESLSSIDDLAAIRAVLPADDWILSLDRGPEGLRDPAGAMGRPDLWPRRVIAMDLGRVGSEAGPVGPWLRELVAAAPDREWIAAGGVRNRADLDALATLGVHTALVATALHQGLL